MSHNSVKTRLLVLLVASKNLSLAVTVDGDTAAFGEGLKDSLDLHGNLDGETGDGIDLGTVVGGLSVNNSIHVNSVAPSDIDLLDASADVKEESAMAVVGALASIREVPLEVDVGDAESVLELPAEGTERHVLEALEIIPLHILGDSTCPVVLVVNNRLTLLDDFPNLLANLDKLIDVDVVVLEVSGDGLGLDGVGGAGQGDGGDDELLLVKSHCNAGNGEKSNKSTHYTMCSARIHNKN